MKSFLLVLLISISSSLFALEPGFYPVDKDGQVVDLEKKADVSINLTTNGKIDIGISGITFSPDELADYFQRVRHKKLIVCLFDKNTRSQSDNLKLSTNLSDFFLKCGFERVVILQAQAFGIGVYSDKSNSRPQPD